MGKQIEKPDMKSDLKDVLEFYAAIGVEKIPVPAPINASEIKQKALEGLIRKIGPCARCKLSSGRRNLVFGEGNPSARLMFIGEAPGREEDIQGRPFVGDAGKLLTRLIEKMGFSREDVYIANIAKCRPPMNRVPEADEVAACIPFLEEQVSIISPVVIMALGAVSAQNLLDTKIPIGKLRGKNFLYRGVPLVPTFHPAYLLRNRKDKELTWQDAQIVLQLLSEKGLWGDGR